ncbi:MAG: hypothetical protein J0H83_09440 [Candidatus Melainabacteria bacterium]|jgi:hypothetical protein|nr:hypothetical protein [Candidatus Melainabacteria bacterium]
MEKKYGLELTNNSKASWAFSLPRSATCIGATDICKKVCYGNGVRYRTEGQKARRERNLLTIELLLEKGGPKLLAENLIALVDTVRPSDWLAASITGSQTQTPWTLRIHDVGDFHSAKYTEAWLLAVQQRPLCSFWFYTRSFSDAQVFDAMTKLASAENCKGWLSIDSDNFASGLLAYAQRPGVWQLALLQESKELLDEQVLSSLDSLRQVKQVVSFPIHRGGHHAEPIQHPALFTCLAVIGVHKLQPDAQKLRPCQACTFCLPSPRNVAESKT